MRKLARLASALSGVMLTEGQWCILALLTLSVNINFLDRGSISVAAPRLAIDLALSPSKLGILLSVFLWTYIPAQLLAGWLVDRYDVKWVFAGGFLIWSIATLACGWIHSLGILMALRMVLGVGEATSYPSYNKIIGSTFPEHQRGFANSVLDTGSKIGPGLGTLVGAMLIAHFGWRVLFYVLGVASLLWLGPWLAWGPHVKTPQIASTQRVKTLQILTKRQAWGTFLGHFCLNYAFYLLLAWLPTYLVMERHYSMKMMAIWGSVPYFGCAATSLLGGWLSDRWITRGASPTKVRLGFMGGGMLAAGITLPLAVLPNETAAMTFLVVSMLATGFFCSNIWAITQTLAGPVAVGRWAGIEGFLCNLSGILAPIATGVIVAKTGSFVLAFLSTSVFLIAGAGFYTFLVRKVEPVSWEREPSVLATKAELAANA
jgi:MFS family permease